MFFVERTLMEPFGQLRSHMPQAVHTLSPFSSSIISRRPRNRGYIVSVSRFSGYCSVTMRRGWKKYLTVTEKPLRKLTDPATVLK